MELFTLARWYAKMRVMKSMIQGGRMYLSPGYHSGVNVADGTAVRTVVSNGRIESHRSMGRSC